MRGIKSGFLDGSYLVKLRLTIEVIGPITIRYLLKDGPWLIKRKLHLCSIGSFILVLELTKEPQRNSS